MMQEVGLLNLCLHTAPFKIQITAGLNDSSEVCGERFTVV